MNQIFDEKQLNTKYPCYFGQKYTIGGLYNSTMWQKKLRKLDGSQILLTPLYFVKSKTSIKSRHSGWAKMIDKPELENLRRNIKKRLSILPHNYAGESAIENWKKTNFYSIRSSAKFFGWLEISSSRFFAKSAIFPIGRAKLHFQSEQGRTFLLVCTYYVPLQPLYSSASLH